MTRPRPLGWGPRSARLLCRRDPPVPGVPGPAEHPGEGGIPPKTPGAGTVAAGVWRAVRAAPPLRASGVGETGRGGGRRKGAVLTKVKTAPSKWRGSTESNR